MITVRPGAERGRTRTEWLDSRHSFSFADYHDPQHMGFRALRVINDDRIRPGSGFPTHPHRDMEIVTYVLEGALSHRDSMGNGSVIRPGEVQRMSAGTGVTHSEWNPSDTETTRLLQIWLLPERRGIAPGYEQRGFDPYELRNALRLVASRDARDRSVTVHQDVDLYVTRLDPGKTVVHALASGRHAWVQMAKGTVRLGAVPLAEGDGAAVTGEERLEIAAHGGPAEVLLFDLA